MIAINGILIYHHIIRKMEETILKIKKIIRKKQRLFKIAENVNTEKCKSFWVLKNEISALKKAVKILESDI